RDALALGDLTGQVGRNERERTGGVGGEDGGAEPVRAFSVVARIAGAARVEVEPVLGGRRGVESPADLRTALRRGRGRERREVLELVRPAVAVARVVRRHVVAAEVDAELAVVLGRVGFD